MKKELTVEELQLQNEELTNRLEEAEQLIEAIKAGEVDAFALNRNNQPEIFTLQSGDHGYRMLVENFSEGALTLSEESLIVYTNGYFHELLGLSYEQVIGKPVFNFIHPASKDAFNELFKKGLAGQSKGEINLTSANKIIPVYVSLTSLYPSLQTVGMVVTDLTDKKEQEEKLQQQNKELTRNRNFISNVLQSTYHGVLSYAAIRKNGEIVDFEITYANEPALEQLNLPAEKVIGNTYLTVIPQAKKYGLWERVTRVLNTGKSESHEVHHPVDTGRTFLVTYAPLDDGVTCTFVEITEQKKRELELEKKNIELVQSEERYHRMIEEVQDYSIILLDNEGIILNWNKGAERIKGYKAGEIIGKSFSTFYTDEDRKRKIPEKLLDKARRTGKATDENYRVRKNVTKFWGSIVITALHDNKNNVIGFVKVTRDLTERKKADEEIKAKAAELEAKNTELQKMNTELQSFAYISSHDLQEPLRKIQTFATRILEKEFQNLSEYGKDSFTRMQLAAKRMQTLIEDLLAYSRTSTSERKVEKTHLNKIIEQVKEDLREDIKEKHAIIEATELCHAEIIPFQFRQMMNNLIGNSLKFSNPENPPYIKIKSHIEEGVKLNNEKLTPENKYCHISISDNGIGFEPQYSDKIFEVFQRLHGKAEYNGTGIGLSIVKKIVENHHGIITAQSELGKGAKFDIYIPAT